MWNSSPVMGRLPGVLLGCCMMFGGASVAVAAAPEAPAPASDEAPRPEVPDAAWRAMRERDVQLGLRGGLEVTGRLVGEDTDSVTLIQAGGAVGVVAKADVETLRVLTPQRAEGPEPPPTPTPTSAPAPAPTPASEPGPAPSAPRGLRKSGGYVLVSPGGLSRQTFIPFGADNFNYPYYQWGIGAGGHVVAKNGFTLTAGLSFRHASRRFDGVRDNFMRIGPEFRFGGSGEKYFAYGLFDFHGIVNRVEGEGAGGVGLSLGAGAQGLLFNRLILGGEFAVPVDYIFNTDWLFPTEDGGMLVAFDLKLLVGVKF